MNIKSMRYWRFVGDTAAVLQAVSVSAPSEMIAVIQGGGPMAVVIGWRDFERIVRTGEMPREWSQYVGANREAEG